MDNTPGSTSDLITLSRLIREHLLKAQEIMDSISGGSVISARLQHILDDLDEQMVRDASVGRDEKAPHGSQ
jgi:hypothetical protein